MPRTATLPFVRQRYRLVQGFAPAPIYRRAGAIPRGRTEKNLQGKWIHVSRTCGGRNPSHRVFAVGDPGRPMDLLEPGW